ncbi:MAG: M1 family aminopeptidase [Promethearchaeota archaeon]
MKPLHYSIYLEPDLKSFTFKGKVDAKIKTEKPVNQVVLDANDLTFRNCKVKKEEKFLDCEFSFNADKQAITITLPEKMDDIIELAIDYTGNINDLLVGFYRSKYEIGGEVRYVAVTQFEERDARRAFPCFDHPAKKATFDIEYLIDEKLKAISNMPILEEKMLENGKKVVRFERTPPMSTYLVFFGVGDFEFIEDSSVKTLVRVATTPGKTKFGKFGLDMARKSLSFGETYTGVKFPLPKCDYIAVPDFAFGAMENWGATLYRENALLVYPGITSKRGVIGVAITIAHETAHMWFGDLVTPAEWKYLWLNESFATFFGNNIIVSHYYPEWQMWDRFIAADFVSALERDSLIETMPIELPGEEEASIDAASAPIIYAKGASILRMLIFSFMGEEHFKKGLNHYLNKYSYSTATSSEFWAALEEASDKPVTTFAESWIHQSGYPIIEVRKTNNYLILKQEEFKLLPHKSDKIWLIPIDILLFLKNGDTKTISIIMNERTMNVSIPEESIVFKLNAGQKGFYRVKYAEKEMLNELGKLAKEQKLNPADSFGIENDFYALVRRGDYSLSEFLAFIEEYYAQETRPLPLDFIGHLRHAYLISESKREQIAAIGKKISENALEFHGFEPKEDENPQVSDTRTALLWTAFKFGSVKVAEFGAAQFQDVLKGKEIHADIRSTILRIGAEVSDQAMEYFKKRVMEEETPETEKIMITSALGAFDTKEKVYEALKFALKSIPLKNKYITITSAGDNLAFIDHSWKWFLENLNELQKLHPMHFQRVILGLTAIGGLGKEDEVRSTLLNAQFYDTHKDAINMALERLQVNSNYRQREG